jgi:hypothetical protein
MGIAVPSVTEASRRLPASVKADVSDADDVLVTSVTIAPSAIDEPVSPELALVDPDLAARLRALLPDIEIEPPPPLLRALPAPEPENVLPLPPPPELVGASASVVPPVALPPPPPIYVYPSRTERIRSFAKAFAIGAAVATVVTVGVVAEMGEGPPAADEPGTTPPRVGSPVPGSSSGGTAAQKPKPATPTATGGAATAGANTAKKVTKSQAKKTSRPRTQGSGQKAKPAPATPGRTSGAKQQSTPSAGAVAEARRFAWAPVDGAIGYRFELFRGDKQILEVRTTQPAYELASRWRHEGRTERLVSGAYRWYVWPVFSSGPGAQAVVQAKLSVP